MSLYILFISIHQRVSSIHNGIAGRRWCSNVILHLVKCTCTSHVTQKKNTNSSMAHFSSRLANHGALDLCIWSSRDQFWFGQLSFKRLLIYLQLGSLQQRNNYCHLNWGFNTGLLHKPEACRQIIWKNNHSSSAMYRLYNDHHHTDQRVFLCRTDP